MACRATEKRGGAPPRFPLVLATRNAGKIRELRQLLAGLDLELLDLRDFPAVRELPEPHHTYAENASAKARTVARATGLPALADDSGLEVDALNGRPGVESARFAGPDATDRDNVERLLRELEGVAPPKRTARFRCVLAVAFPDGFTAVVEGSCRGCITERPRGRGGFGYDPVFVPARSSRTFAELRPEEKLRYSHRTAAALALRPRLPGLLAGRPQCMSPASGGNDRGRAV